MEVKVVTMLAINGNGGGGGDCFDSGDGGGDYCGNGGSVRVRLGQSVGGGAQTQDRGVPVDLRADSLSTMPPTVGLCGNGDVVVIVDVIVMGKKNRKRLWRQRWT
ncbi:hypothetical protein PoB_002028600 [Plakobranchus ocellatus]|uniref:Uncharacterized protein n=1 Tax=Plakobranchus ocellatus TaxID=259542 RepID=A0AAV3ZCZ9_9GAST|nr:hypothetical protein PoB_002028600 [Plakobranchus ocellatus]